MQPNERRAALSLSLSLLNSLSFLPFLSLCLLHTRMRIVLCFFLGRFFPSLAHALRQLLFIRSWNDTKFIALTVWYRTLVIILSHFTLFLAFSPLSFYLCISLSSLSSLSPFIKLLRCQLSFMPVTASPREHRQQTIKCICYNFTGAFFHKMLLLRLLGDVISFSLTSLIAVQCHLCVTHHSAESTKDRIQFLLSSHSFHSIYMLCFYLYLSSTAVTYFIDIRVGK